MVRFKFGKDPQSSFRDGTVRIRGGFVYDTDVNIGMTEERAKELIKAGVVTEVKKDEKGTPVTLPKGKITPPPKENEEVEEEKLRINRGELKKEEKEELKEEVLEPETVESKTYIREELEKKRMGELRVIGREFGVKDNKKSELIDKIIEAAK